MPSEPTTGPSPTPFAALKFAAGDDIDPDLVRLIQDGMASQPATPTTAYRLEFGDGQRVFVEDRGDHVRVWRPTADMLRSGGPVQEVEDAANAFAAALARHTDAETQALVSLVRRAAHIYRVERILAVARPDDSVDVPTHFVQDLADEAAKMKAKLAGGTLREMTPPDAAGFTCLWLTNLLIRPYLLAPEESDACTRCGRITSQARWAYEFFSVEGKVKRRLCNDCAHGVPLCLAQELFAKLPYENPSITSLFHRFSSVAIKEHFRANFSGVVASIQAGLECERLLVEHDINPAALRRTFEIPEHYAHIPLEQTLLHLGARKGAVSALLRPWDRHVKGLRAQRANQNAKGE